MRDNDGKALSNAHVLGFLRRIAKLLFYGIKPVFVFDGGAPALKRNTLVGFISLLSGIYVDLSSPERAQTQKDWSGFESC
jgi:hypothetical protein